jgi:hypothetical protein
MASNGHSDFDIRPSFVIWFSTFDVCRKGFAVNSINLVTLGSIDPLAAPRSSTYSLLVQSSQLPFALFAQARGEEDHEHLGARRSGPGPRSILIGERHRASDREITFFPILFVLCRMVDAAASFHPV